MDDVKVFALKKINSFGQTSVEYILLLAVVVSIAFGFFNSEFFNRYFGEGGEIAQAVKLKTEFAYRHAYFDSTSIDVTTPIDYSNAQSHPSYYLNGSTRFFGPAEAYPQ